MKLILCDPNRHMVRRWGDCFANLPEVEIRQASMFEVGCTAITSPANSFGFMDGGLDLRINEFFKFEIEDRVRQVIRAKHDGELMVGQAEVVETGHEGIPYLVVAPTMRVPMIIDGTVNVYLAMRAVLRSVRAFNCVNDNGIDSLAVPGLGTGIGLVPCEVAALQMRTAYDEVMLNNNRLPASWLEARNQHEYLAEGIWQK